MEARFGPTDVKWSFKISHISAGFVKELSPLFSSLIEELLVHLRYVNSLIILRVRRYWEIEESKETLIINPEERFARETVSRSLTFADGHYSVGMPWKRDRPLLPDNYSVTLNRLQCTEKKLKQCPELGEAYKIKQWLSTIKTKDTLITFYVMKFSLIKSFTYLISQC